MDRPISGVEFIIVEMSTKFSKILLCNIYRVKKCPSADFVLFIEYMLELTLKYEHAFIMGDLNINNFDADKSKTLDRLKNSNYWLCNDKCPTHIIPNRVPSQIDLMFAKIKHRVIGFDHFDSCGISNHQTLLVSYNILPNKKTKQIYSFRSYNKVNMNELNIVVSNIDWLNLYLLRDVTDKVNMLTSTLCTVLNHQIPIKQITNKNAPVPWMTPEINDLMKQRDSFYKMFKMNERRPCKQAAYQCYKILRNKVKTEINKAKKNHSKQITSWPITIRVDGI